MTWQQTIDEERYEAHEEGWKKGLIDGIAEGERNARLETARRMLATNIGTPEQIADITQLSLAEIQQLR